MTVDCLNKLEIYPTEIKGYEAIKEQEDRNLFHRIFGSRVLWTGISGVGLAYFSVPALGVLGLYSFYARKEIFGEASQYYNIAMYRLGMHTNWGNHVYSHPNGAELWVGAVPAANFGHTEALKSKGINAVLSVMNRFELNETLALCPVKQETWEKNGIEHLLLESDDCTGLNNEIFEKGLTFIHESLEKGNSLYVHCKAGKGRSVSLILAYFVKYLEMGDLDHSIAILKAIRPQINFNQGQKRAIEEYLTN